jgi:hypothetical protein
MNRILATIKRAPIKMAWGDVMEGSCVKGGLFQDYCLDEKKYPAL